MSDDESVPHVTTIKPTKSVTWSDPIPIPISPIPRGKWKDIHINLRKVETEIERLTKQVRELEEKNEALRNVVEPMALVVKDQSLTIVQLRNRIFLSTENPIFLDVRKHWVQPNAVTCPNMGALEKAREIYKDTENWTAQLKQALSESCFLNDKQEERAFMMHQKIRENQFWIAQLNNGCPGPDPYEADISEKQMEEYRQKRRDRPSNLFPPNHVHPAEHPAAVAASAVKSFGSAAMDNTARLMQDAGYRQGEELLWKQFAIALGVETYEALKELWESDMEAVGKLPGPDVIATREVIDAYKAEIDAAWERKRMATE